MAKISAKDIPGTIELLVAENDKLTKALREFVRFYQRYERDWSNDFRATTEFLDLRETYDGAREALTGDAP